MYLDFKNTNIEELFKDSENSNELIIEFLKNQQEKLIQLQENQLRYNSLFENSPISLWEEDLSNIKNYLDQQSINGSTIESFLNNHPETVATLVSLIKIVDINKATLKLYKANSKEELLGGLSRIFTPDSFNTFKQLIICVFNKVYSFETESINKNLANEKIHIKIKYEVVPGFEESLKRVIVSVIDITEEKLIKEQLTFSEQRFIEAQSVARFGNWYFNYETKTIERSPEVLKIFEVEESQLDNSFDAFLKFVHPEDVSEYLKVYNNALKEQKPYEHQYRIITAKGNLKYVLEKGHTFFDSSNIPIRTIGTGQDITEQVIRDSNIKEIQLQYHTLFDNAPIALFEENFSDVIKKLQEIGANETNISEILKDEQVFQHCLQLIFVNNINKEALKLFKAENIEEFHKKLPFLFTKHSIKIVKDIFIKITLGQTSGEYETLLKTVDGQVFNAIVKFSVLQYKKDSGKLLFSVENITLRKNLLKEIQEKQENLNQAQKIALIGSFSLVHENNIISRSDEFYRIFETTPEQLPNREECFLNFVHKDDVDELVEVFHGAIEKKIPYQLTYRIITGKGNLKYIYEKGNTIYDEYGNPIKTIGTLQDITEKKIAEGKIKEAHNIIENSNSIAIVWENAPSWPIKYVSENVERILGFTAVEMLEEIKNFGVIMHPEDVGYSDNEAFKFLNDSKTENYTLSPYRVFTKDKKIKWVTERTNVIRNKDGVVERLHGFIDDITEQHQLETAINTILNTVSKVTGTDYLEEITLQLSNVLHADYTFIGLMDDENPLIMNTIYTCYKGDIIDNFSYLIEGSPCYEVLNMNTCCYPNNVATLFPKDIALSTRGIKGYLGVPLYNSQKESIGIMVGLYKNPIENPHFAESVIQLFSSRTGAEIQRIKSEEKLKESEFLFNSQLLKLNTAIDSVNDVVFMTDTNGIFSYVNHSFTELYGYSPNEVINIKTPNILKGGFISNDIYKNLWNSLLHNEKVNIEIKNKSKNGNLIDIYASFSAITNDNDEIIGFVSIQRDITEKKKAEIQLKESEAEAWSLFDEAPYPIWIEDFRKVKQHFNKLKENGINNLRDYLNSNPDAIIEIAQLIEIKKVNKVSLEFYEVTREELLTKHISDFLIPESYPIFVEELVALFNGKTSYKSELPIRKLNGQLIYLMVNVSIPEIYKDTFEKVIISFVDITEQKRADLIKDVLLNITKQITDVSSIESFSLVVKKELGVLLDTSNFYIALYNKEDDTIAIPYFADDLEEEIGENIIFNAEGSLTGHVIKTKKPLLATKKEFKKLENLGKLILIGPPSLVWLGVPLFSKGEAIGAIAVQSYTNVNAYTESDQKILEIVAEQIALAIERIQSQNKIRENEEKFRSIFELSPDMINLIDLNGTLLDCNDELVKQLGYQTKNQLIGKNYLKRFKESDVESISKNFQLIINQGSITNQEYYLTRLDGSVFPVEISAVLNYDENNLPKNIIGIGRDITLRKKHEVELTNALEKAKKADKLKSAFLANMSHEIRTPMNGILGFSELLTQNHLTEEKRALYANIILNSGKQLLSIINDVLDMSTIESGLVSITKEPVCINSLIKELSTFFNQKSEEKGLKLLYNLSLNDDISVINTDSTKVRQILTNLISNAIKFTKKGTVSVGYTVKNNFIEFYVKDTGIGINHKFHEEIFERFRQVNKDFTKETIGNGLGLSITKRLVELLNGNIWIESEENMGSTFYFTLPYDKDNIEIIEEIQHTDKIQQPMNEQITILVAEDEEYNRIFIEEIFADFNFNILTAENGKEAVDIAKDHPEINFILMDVKMPVMSGIEATQTIKKINSNIPIIALTAFSMDSDKEFLMKQGFDDYLPKPILKKDLIRILDSYTLKKND